MTGLSVLIVEDDEDFRDSMVALLRRDGLAVREAETMAAARAQIEEAAPDVVLLDLTLPDGDGLALLADEDLAEPEYVVTTGNATADSAIAALREGALDYLPKPVDRARLRAVLANVARTRGLKGQVSELRDELRNLGRFGSMVGRSKAMQQVYDLVGRVAPTESTVFVIGESGTGKELVAETVHALSRRKDGPFLAVNCGAMSPTLIESELFGHEKGSFTGADRRRQGYFEQVDGGTLFLDEITEMPIELQVKLLRVLETGTITRVGAASPTPVDVRIVTASNRDPHEAVAEEILREDLLYRLNVFPVHVPPLRERGNDVELLARHFLETVNEREGTSKRLSDDALARLRELSWPGNVRELKNTIERAAILADTAIGPDLLPEPDPSRVASAQEARLEVQIGAPIAEVERRLILATLEELGGNKRRAAEVLGISLKTLYNRLNVYEAARGES
ncbi:MAG TPA: sigma-54 dependent transcriptional regulator [Myxococcota bacterium]|nr:sigma-54 dependent transcriptional regulator [Myxococcota bacterium]